MEQTVKITVSKKPPMNSSGVVSYKNKKMKRGLFKKIFGVEPDQVTIIVPGPEVSNVEIITMPKGMEAKK